MDNPITQALSIISQGALYPVIVVLLILMAVTLVLVVMAIVEFFTERRTFRVSVPEFIREVDEAPCKKIPSIIATSALLKRQKVALMQLFNARDLPQESRWNVAKRAVYECGEHYRRREAVAETVSKIAPMLGLMGTLIPLGPGLQALSSGQIGDLASALVVAFDTTVIGLISAALCLLVARVRGKWNADYANALDSMEGALFDRIAELEEAGDLTYEAPKSYALTADKGEKASKKKADKDTKAKDADEKKSDADEAASDGGADKKSEK